jgi:hypothetical protein
MSDQATPQRDSEEDERHEGTPQPSQQNREEQQEGVRPVDPAPEDESPAA